jgi:hypothetical protein
MLPSRIIAAVALSKLTGSLFTCAVAPSACCCVIGGKGSTIFLLIPRNPSRKIALSAKCGCTSAPGTRISRRVDVGEHDGGEMMRTEAARQSYPYVTFTMRLDRATPCESNNITYFVRRPKCFSSYETFVAVYRGDKLNREIISSSTTLAHSQAHRWHHCTSLPSEAVKA